MSKARCSIYLEEDIKEWCQFQAEVMGMSLSAFLTMCVYQYRQSQEGLKAMQNISIFAEQLQSMKEMFESMQSKEKLESSR